MRIALGVEYNGSSFYGWQLQRGLPTVQQALEQALSTVANETIEIHCAGRTDKGVHATGQVVHFDTHAIRNERSWLLGINSHLPPDVSVSWVKSVSDSFHARFSAQTRRYQYLIFNYPSRASILQQRVSWYYRPLNEKAMAEAASYLLGTHDFTSFRSSECQAQSAVRTLHMLKVNRYQHFVIIEAMANGFLHHMVRNIAGVLMAVGKGQQKPEWTQTVLAARNRVAADVTAAPEGLYLTEVSYPSEFAIPKPVLLPPVCGYTGGQ